MVPNSFFHFFIGGIIVSAVWAALSFLLMRMLHLRDPKARVVVLVAPLIAMFVGRMRLSGELAVALLAVSFILAGALFIKDMMCCMRTTRRLRTSSKTTPALDALAQRLALQFGTRVPRILISDEAVQPFTAGALHPIIVLPTSVAKSLTGIELEVLLAHEMAHIKRHDFLLKWVLLFATRLSWLNPLAPALFRRISFEMECACDKLASQLTGRPGTLARTLVKTEQLVCLQGKDGNQHLVMGACSFLESRIRLLSTAIDTTPEFMVSGKVALILFTLALACFKIAPIWFLFTSI